MRFKLPPEITVTKKQLASGGEYAYVFCHKQLGELGRLHVLHNNGQACLKCEVTGDAHDALTRMRQEILEPITLELVSYCVNYDTFVATGYAAPGLADDCTQVAWSKVPLITYRGAH